MRSGRTQPERDSVTVELVYALVTGALLATAGFAGVISPVLGGVLHGEARKACVTVAVIVSVALFCGRVAITLRRFERQNRLSWQESALSEEDATLAGDRLRVPGQRRAEPGERAPWEDRGPSGPSDQPSQPGLTSPDS